MALFAHEDPAFPRNNISQELADVIHKAMQARSQCFYLTEEDQRLLDAGGNPRPRVDPNRFDEVIGADIVLLLQLAEDIGAIRDRLALLEQQVAPGTEGPVAE